MPEIGYALSSEEHPPLDLVRDARRAEEAGFSFILISDHYHPWLSEQGHSPFVWSVIGGISQVTKRVRVGTGVTAPIIRIHPAIVAQAAATAACMLPGRFFLGVGTGENLNEHVVGEGWPPIDIRQEMLIEAVEIIDLLMSGKEESYFGSYYTVENARLFTVPDQALPIFVAASGPESAAIAGEIGDGLISVAPSKGLVEAFHKNGGEGLPTIGQVAVCWARTEAEARKTAWKYWRNGAIGGPLSVDLPTYRHFEAAAEPVTEEMVAQNIICSPDKDRHIQAVREMFDAGYEQVYIHQIGPDQEGFINFYRENILPAFR